MPHWPPGAAHHDLLPQSWMLHPLLSPTGQGIQAEVENMKYRHFQQKCLFICECVKPLIFTGCFSIPLDNLISLFHQAWMDTSTSPLACSIHRSRKFCLHYTQNKPTSKSDYVPTGKPAALLVDKLKLTRKSDRQL